MTLLEAPLISAIASTGTFLLCLWIAWSLHRHRGYDEPGVTLRQRLRHPTTPTEELKEQQRGEQRGGE